MNTLFDTAVVSFSVFVVFIDIASVLRFAHSATIGLLGFAWVFAKVKQLDICWYKSKLGLYL